MKIPERMIHQSFRYCLGRRSYAVGDWCDWFHANFDKIPNDEKAIIKQDLEWAIKRDNESRENGRDYHPLGDGMDRKRWLEVAALLGL